MATPEAIESIATTATTADPMQTRLHPEYLGKLLALNAKLADAGHGLRGALVADFAADHGLAKATVYRQLEREAGFDAGRKIRADRGTTRLPQATLDALAAAKREGKRGNGKAIMPTCVAMNVADANGMVVNVGASRINALLRQQGLTHQQLTAQRPTIRMRSEHPNHVHEIDPSLCVLYYIGGKQAVMDAEKFYKNKWENFSKVMLKVWRYVAYDHFSASITVKYYESAGENQRILFDFLMHSFSKRPQRLQHGLPRLVLWDKGSANTSLGIRNMLDALDVQHETHTAHHAWAKGGVENANHVVETHFESRLKIEPVQTVAQLNEAAQAWARAYNANAIKHVDSRVIRDSGEPLVRDDLWHSIRPEQLRACPERSVCEWFFAAGSQERTVRNLQISFAHPELGKSVIYKLHDYADQLSHGEKVTVYPLLGQGGALRVEIAQLGAKEPLRVKLLPVTEFDAAGRALDGQVFGQGYSRAPDNADVLAAKRLNELTYGVRDLDVADAKRTSNVRPFAAEGALAAGKGLVAHSQLKDVQTPERLPRAAQPLQGEHLAPAVAAATNHAASHERLMSLPEAVFYIKAIVESLGREFDVSISKFLSQRYPSGGISQSAADAIAYGDAAAATGTDDAAPQAAHPSQGLRLVK